MKRVRAIVLGLTCVFAASNSTSLLADTIDEGQSGNIILDNDAAVSPRSNVNVKVTNRCPFNLWIHGAGNGGVLQPDDAILPPNTLRNYSAPGDWSASRVEAYKAGPRQDQIEKVEMTFDHNGQGQQVLNYNVTYVDWVGLPVSIIGIGSGSDCRAAGCNRPVNQLLNGCPDGLNDGERCLSARTYCLNPMNQGNPYCHLFDGKINECADRYGDCQGARGSSTAEVYACSGGFFSQNPKYCAAINRGMLDNPYSTDKGQYYRNGPYNSYSKWVHDSCPGLYAFPYDDFPGNAGESGFHSCSGATELQITFCPAG